jgi:imidazolonepropionase
LKPNRQPKPLLLANVGQLLTLRSNLPGPRRGSELKELAILEDAAVLCLGGKIVSIGKTKDALRDPWFKKNRAQVTEIDCAGKVVLPGFVDSHTHPAFISPRLLDFEKRTSGASYEEIAEAGGGIRSSVDAVRAASKKEISTKVWTALLEMSAYGTTTVEAKSNHLKPYAMRQ